MTKLLSFPCKQKNPDSLETKLANKAKRGNSESFIELYKLHKIYK